MTQCNGNKRMARTFAHVAAVLMATMVGSVTFAADAPKPAAPAAKPAAPAAKPVATAPAAAAAGAKMPATIQEGIFTRAQAKRGDTIYTQHCAMCHMADMAGKEPAPELAGDSFLAKWLDHSVGELFTRVSTTMPAGNPGTLTPAQYADVVALLLEANNFKAGAAEMKADEAALEKIVIKKK